KYAFIALQRAVRDLADNKIDALVTAPINKHNIRNEAFQFPGHTEYLQHTTGASDSLMFMLSDELRVGVATGHVPLQEGAGRITIPAIMSKLRNMHASLNQHFWLQKPKIAVLGFNPHPRDNRLIGTEEHDIIV